MTEPRNEYSQAATGALHRSVLLANNRKQSYATLTSLLLAIIDESRCDAVKTMSATGVNMRSLRRSVSRLSSSDPDGGQQMDGQGRPTQMSAHLSRAIGRAHENARREGVPLITTRDLLLGIIEQAGGELQALLLEQGVDAALIRAKATQVNEFVPLDAEEKTERAQKEALRAGRPRFMISPVFLGLIAVAIGSGYVLYTMPDYATIAFFIFILSGWIISLALHEFGHALAAYFGGDYSVVEKGYLTLNPLLYTHSVLSIVLPVVILLMGGIGLPGGAVYINRGAIRSTVMHSVVSAAGPFANILCAAGLSIFYFVMKPDPYFPEPEAFWYGIALLILLQVTAVLLNLIPIPGLDGFGIIAPWLPISVLRALAPFYGYGFMLLIGLFWFSDTFASWFWGSVGSALLWMGIDPGWASAGLDLFMFWQ